VLDFVHRMETKDGTKASLRQVGILIAGICGLELPVETPARKGARKPQDGPPYPDRREGPSTPAKAPQDAPGGLQKPTGEGREIKPNKPLGFSLTLDPDHPNLAEWGLTPELVATFGLGFCTKGIMAGRVCIPIHDWQGRLVALRRPLGRTDRGPSRREGQVRVPRRLPQGARALQHPPRVDRRRVCMPNARLSYWLPTGWVGPLFAAESYARFPQVRPEASYASTSGRRLLSVELSVLPVCAPKCSQVS
jgi:hypothetical protein